MKNLSILILSFLLLQSCATKGPLEKKLDAKSASMMSNPTPEMKKIGMVFEKATVNLKASGIEKKALKKGVKVPNFKVGRKKFSSIYKKQVTIVKFYRGHWCPYCMVELKEYESLYSEFTKANAQIIAFVPDKIKFIKKTKRDHQITFPIYRDVNQRVAKKFGMAFKLDSKIKEIYKKFNIDLKKSQGNSNDELAMPGTFVIDQDGIIQYAFYDADYTKRAEPSKVLEIVKKLNK